MRRTQFGCAYSLLPHLKAPAAGRRLLVKQVTSLVHIRLKSTSKIILLAVLRPLGIMLTPLGVLQANNWLKLNQKQSMLAIASPAAADDNWKFQHHQQQQQQSNMSRPPTANSVPASQNTPHHPASRDTNTSHQPSSAPMMAVSSSTGTVVPSATTYLSGSSAGSPSKPFARSKSRGSSVGGFVHGIVNGVQASLRNVGHKSAQSSAYSVLIPKSIMSIKPLLISTRLSRLAQHACCMWQSLQMDITRTTHHPQSLAISRLKPRYHPRIPIHQKVPQAPIDSETSLHPLDHLIERWHEVNREGEHTNPKGTIIQLDRFVILVLVILPFQLISPPLRQVTESQRLTAIPIYHCLHCLAKTA